MSFSAELENSVAPARARLFELPFFSKLKSGTLTKEEYARYLVEVFHQVRHTPRLLAAASSRLPFSADALFHRLMENATEEGGHEKWALSDVAALGFDTRRIPESYPLPATEALIAYAYFVIQNVNPVGLVGIIYSLETLGADTGSGVVEALKAQLKVGNEAMKFIGGHAAADPHHVEELRRAIDAVATTDELKRLIIRTSTVAYHLYAGILASATDQTDSSLCLR